jgi:DNA-binding CsgD family transcriptional regulator
VPTWTVLAAPLLAEQLEGPALQQLALAPRAAERHGTRGSRGRPRWHRTLPSGQDELRSEGRGRSRASHEGSHASCKRDDGYRAAFEESLEWHARAGRTFELGRAQLAYGERLRRDRHRLDARRQLRAAIDSFDQLGATPWPERARRELLASGETTHPRAEASRELLTPQELQVARLAADGLSNNEIATRLFISPRTVEKHLTSAFRKLDVSSRRGLILAGPTLLSP